MAWESEGYWRCTPASGGSPGPCSPRCWRQTGGSAHRPLSWLRWTLGELSEDTEGFTATMCSHSSRTLQGTRQWAGLSVALRTGALCSPMWQSISAKHPWKMEPCSSEGPLSMSAPKETAGRAALAAATHRRENPVFYPAEPSQPVWLMRAACCCALQGQD